MRIGKNLEKKCRANPKRKARILERLLSINFLRIDAILFENSIKPGGSRFAVLNNLVELSFISKSELRIFEVLLAIFNLSL